MAGMKARKIASDDVFETGRFELTSITVKTSHTSRPPVQLFIVAPVEKGTYPVLLFCHGFLITNTWYTTLLQHTASHGYIVVAPRFYGLIWPVSIQEEINKAARVAEWLSTGLPNVLPEQVNCDMDNIALSGHSRGGNTAFALALGKADQKSRKDKTSVNDISHFKAIIGVDPVAGSSPSSLSAPKILKYIPRCFDNSVPVAVIGTAYSNQKQGIMPPFSPDGVNHSEFYNESKPPACYFLTKEYGHTDMLDDWIAKRLSIAVKSGDGSRDLMRKGVGGIVVAFLKSYLGGDEDDLNAIVGDPSIAPITLDPVIYVKE